MKKLNKLELKSPKFIENGLSTSQLTNFELMNLFGSGSDICPSLFVGCDCDIDDCVIHNCSIDSYYY